MTVPAGLAFVVAGPSGVGKSTLVSRLLADDARLHASVSVTTRASRPGDLDGVHYHFVSDETFQLLVREDAFLEWARVLNGTRCYGTLRKPVEAALRRGDDVLLDLDWQGYRQLRRLLPEQVVGVFIMPPTIDALHARLVQRGADGRAEIDRRMAVAQDEMSHAGEFDYVVANHDVSRTVDTLRGIIAASRQRVRRG